MIFPLDSEIREFSTYCIRCRKIVIEEFKQNEGRSPDELELQDLLKMVIVPFGILKQQNGSFHPPIQQQTKPQAPTAKPKTDSIMDIVNAHKDKMRIDGDKVVLTGKIDDYWSVVDEFKHRGWKHTPAEKLSTGKWKDGYFESMGVKA